jgi:hypothetical protein
LAIIFKSSWKQETNISAYDVGTKLLSSLRGYLNLALTIFGDFWFQIPNLTEMTGNPRTLGFWGACLPIPVASWS